MLQKLQHAQIKSVSRERTGFPLSYIACNYLKHLSLSWSRCRLIYLCSHQLISHQNLHTVSIESCLFLLTCSWKPEWICWKRLGCVLFMLSAEEGTQFGLILGFLLLLFGARMPAESQASPGMWLGLRVSNQSGWESEWYLFSVWSVCLWGCAGVCMCVCRRIRLFKR